MNRKTRGFTLIELLVVIVILGVLAGYVAPNYFNQLKKAKIGAAKTQIRALENALDRYRVDTGDYPDTAQGLQALVAEPAGTRNWDGPYLRKSPPPDPWGNAYEYQKSEDAVIIKSLGADGQTGGDDENADIVNR